MLVKPGEAEPTTLAECGEIDDFIPLRGTDEYFFVKGGELRRTRLAKGAPSMKIETKPHISIRRLLLLLAKSSSTTVLLVEEVPRGDTEFGPLWEVMVENGVALAKVARAKQNLDWYKRKLHSARCKQDDRGCLYIGNDIGTNRQALDLEPSPGASRIQLMPLSGGWVNRAVFHPINPDKFLLTVLCSKK